MTGSSSTEPAASDLPVAVEEELQALRTAQAERERELAAIVLERAAIDDERMTLLQERAAAERERDDERRRWELERSAWDAQRLELERLRAAWEDERARMRRALRWSPRHWLGVLAHRSAAVRRLRSGG